LADETIPRCFNKYVYECPDEEDDEDYTFLKLVRNASKITIKNICGTEAHLRKLEMIGQNQLGNIEYLYLEFDDDENTQDSDELARQYVECFRRYFGGIRILRIETIGDRNFTRMLKMMMDDPSFPWFE
jgi:hypothetical protein